jgi:hypothetical protein
MGLPFRPTQPVSEARNFKDMIPPPTQPVTQKKPKKSEAGVGWLVLKRTGRQSLMRLRPGGPRSTSPLRPGVFGGACARFRQKRRLLGQYQISQKTNPKKKTKKSFFSSYF